MKKHTPEELNKIIDDVINSDFGIVADWMEEALLSQKSKDELFKQYISTVQTYFYYLRESDKNETYELSNKILQVLDIEEAHFIFLCEEYTHWFIDGGEGKEEIESIRKEFNTIYNTDGDNE